MAVSVPVRVAVLVLLGVADWLRVALVLCVRDRLVTWLPVPDREGVRVCERLPA